MIQEDEHILFISQAKTAVLVQQKEALKTGMEEKKIVVTTRRCLFFESLSNVVAEIQYEVMKSKKNKNKPNKEKPPEKKRLSINEFPEHSFPIAEREAKIIINEEPTCHKYLTKMGLRNFIKSTTGIVILKNLPKYKFQLMAFPMLKDAFRFAKGVQCSKAWILYEKYCVEQKVQINYLWTSILVDIINNENCICLIDPDLFITGSIQQMKSFEYLIDRVVFAHTFKHRYAITSNQICKYSQEFLQLFKEQTHSLIYSQTGMTDIFFRQIFSDKIKLPGIMHIDLSKNKLTDYIFTYLQKLVRQSKKMSHIVLSHNQITLNEANGFVGLLKGARVALTIDLSHNSITDACIETVEKFVIFPHNPPLEEINFSFNKFTKKGAWRLFVGNSRMMRYHNYMNFVLYPVPFKDQTFPDSPIPYPVPAPQMNFNLHSALIEQFEQESFMKHTLHEILTPTATILRIIRKLPDNLRLPKTKEELQKILTLSNQIENFMYTPQTVQAIEDLAHRISDFPFNLPPSSIKRYIKYISDKLNEALFIRDHYAVRYILMAFRRLNVDFSGYIPRLKKVEYRDEIMKDNVQKIINFEVDETKINNMLDEMVREGLRLYLQGNAIQALYYLKYCRDREIERFLYEKMNPENYLFSKMAEKNLQLDEMVNEKDLFVPYEIKVEKRINENLYLHPWQANYLVLAHLTKNQLDECLNFMSESTKREKFAVYFDRIEERIQFMRNEFKLFSYYRFKSSYTDLKVNSSRLLSMYNFISEKTYYLQIPSMTRKVGISIERLVDLANPKKFKNQYHIANYFNINYKARNSGFFNYTKKMTRYYQSEIFEVELKKMLGYVNIMYQIIEKLSLTNPDTIPSEIMPSLIEIIKIIRQAVYPNQLKEEFYLRLLSFRNGRHMNNTEILQYLPFLSMYLRPPLPIEKYLIAAILSNQNLNISKMPLCFASIINKPTVELEVQALNQEYIQRDWLGPQSLLAELMENNGKIKIAVQLLTKEDVTITIPESNTIKEVYQKLVQMLRSKIQDVIHYWLYMGNIGETGDLIILEENQYIGEILAEKSGKKKYFLFRRRIFSPEIRYNFRKQSSKMIDSLYYDWKFEYMSGLYFISDEMMFENAAKICLIETVQQIEEHNQKNLQDKIKFDEALNSKMKKLFNHYRGYIPEKAMKHSLMSQQDILIKLKETINERVSEKDHTKILEMKIKILEYYREFPEFMSTNHIMADRHRKELKVSINMFKIMMESEDQFESIGFQKIVAIIPKLKYLMIYYHKHESIVGQINIVGSQNQILGIANQLHTYCTMRCKISSLTLYNAYKFQNLKQKNNNSNKSPEPKIAQQLRRLEKKMQSLPSFLLDFSNIVYLFPNRYIKVFSQRKLYANASLDKLGLEDEEGFNYNQFQTSKELMKNHNTFEKIFPKLADHQEVPSQSKIYDPYYPPPSNPTPTEPLDIPDLTPLQKSSQPNYNDDDFAPITNANRKNGRLPPKQR